MDDARYYSINSFGRSKWVSNGRRFVFFSGRTRPVCSVFALVLVKLMRGMIRSIKDCNVSRHLWWSLVLRWRPRWAHWKRWSPLVSKSRWHKGQISGVVLSQMLSRRQLCMLKRKRSFHCRLRSSERGRSSRPCPSLPSRMSFSDVV